MLYATLMRRNVEPLPIMRGERAEGVRVRSFELLRSEHVISVGNPVTRGYIRISCFVE